MPPDRVVLQRMKHEQEFKAVKKMLDRMSIEHSFNVSRVRGHSIYLVIPAHGVKIRFSNHRSKQVSDDICFDSFEDNPEKLIGILAHIIHTPRVSEFQPVPPS